jgi:hypothetical protein
MVFELQKEIHSKKHLIILNMIVIIERRDRGRGFNLKFFDSEIRLEVGEEIIRRWCPPTWSVEYKTKYIQKHI